MNEITLMPATAADGPAIVALLQRSALPTEGLLKHLGAAVVARRGGDIVGSAALELYADGALLRSVAVDARERGTGVGQRLTQYALSCARAQGISAVYLLTTTAQGFFPRFGFVAIDRSDVPAGVRGSVEFTSVCPASATVMRATID